MKTLAAVMICALLGASAEAAKFNICWVQDRDLCKKPSYRTTGNRHDHTRGWNTYLVWVLNAQPGRYTRPPERRQETTHPYLGKWESTSVPCRNMGRRETCK